MAPMAPEQLPASGSVVVEEGDAPRRWSLLGEVVHIGRGHGADVRLDNSTLSPRHALIVRRGPHAALLDDNSPSGVYVNGRRVERAELADGDEIRLGAVRLRYRAA